MVRVSSLLAIAASASCYSPSPPSGDPCGSDNACPSPYVCTGGYCLPVGIDAHGVDVAAATDASIDGHIAALVPSNGVSPTLLAKPNLAPVVFPSGATTIDTDDGTISGIGADITGFYYEPETFDGATLGVFAFSSLTLANGADVQLVGSASAVFLVGTATIDGTIDGGGGGCLAGHAGCAGPGGGGGAILTAIAGGCGPGGAGASMANADSGGGGGGGGGSGAGGGSEGVTAPGGDGGTLCLADSLEPLVGGGGGGGGGPGAGSATSGGGGGGALQISAMQSLVVRANGVITMGGGGGSGGPAGTLSVQNSGAGAGGGAGGAILLESPSLTISFAAILAANGGGGGGGGGPITAGSDGASGSASSIPAPGGVPVMNEGTGGAGGAGVVAPSAGEPAPGSGATNGGGGGGGVGKILLRARRADADRDDQPARDHRHGRH